MSLREKSGSSRVICRDETERDGTGRARRRGRENEGDTSRSRKLNPPTRRRWVGRSERAVSINKQKLSCYRCERVQVDRMHVARYTEVVLAKRLSKLASLRR